MPVEDPFEDPPETEDEVEGLAPSVLVISPSGAEIRLATEAEKDYYEQISARYLKDNILANVSDLQELDRILVAETMCYRWSQWLLEEKDYFGEAVNVSDLQKYIKEHSAEIRLVKKSLGLDKASREKAHGESVADYIHNLRLRAREFGIVRNEQAVKAITLWMELVGVVTFHLNSDEDERTEFHIHEKDVIAWIVSKIPEFDAIDKAFRETSQAYWIRDI